MKALKPITAETTGGASGCVQQAYLRACFAKAAINR